jgi:hypothetical protein
MVTVIGRWGEGTSLLASVVKAHGFWTGEYDMDNFVPWLKDRCKHGVEEDEVLAQLMERNCPDAAVLERIQQLRDLAGIRDQRLALKLPWLLLRPRLWLTVAEQTDKSVWIERPSKPMHKYTVQRNLQALAAENKGLMEKVWAGHVPIHKVTFEDLIRDPEPTVRGIAEFLEVDFDPESISLIDEDWMRNKVPNGR